jgi:predicted dienelactone hydrolase
VKFTFACSLAALCVLSCSSSESSTAQPSPDTGAITDASDDSGIPPARKAIPGDSIYEKAGPYPVGHATFVLADTEHARSLRIEAWYPADESARAAASAGTALADLEPAGPHHDTLAGLVAKAKPCARTRVSSAADVKPLAGDAWPVVMFSHCHGCARYSSALLMERLASHGIAVLAPEHTSDTVFDTLAGKLANLDAAFLAVRVSDIRFTLGTVLDPASAAVPESLRGRFSSSKIGMMGHSFGSVTTGAVLAHDSRFLAGFAIAAPFDLLAGTKVAELKQPVFFLLAQEDNSISEIGNNLIRNDFKTMTAKTWLAEVADAGHFSFSDICGLHDFNAGCGRAQRQTDTIFEFNYLENESARALGASYAVAFFRGQLMGDAAGLAFAGEAHPIDIVTMKTR